MKKEKTIKTYQRRTKTGKTVTVRAHKSSYEAGNGKRDTVKTRSKKNAGVEFEKRTSMPDPKLSTKDYLDALKKRQADLRKEKIKKTKRPVNGSITGLEPKKKSPAKKKGASRREKPSEKNAKKLIYSSSSNVYKRDSNGELIKVGKWNGKKPSVKK